MPLCSSDFCKGSIRDRRDEGPANGAPVSSRGVATPNLPTKIVVTKIC